MKCLKGCNGDAVTTLARELRQINFTFVIFFQSLNKSKWALFSSQEINFSSHSSNFLLDV